MKEKTAMELAWLEQQKQELQNKGADEQYPNLAHKRRTILESHQKHKVHVSTVVLWHYCVTSDTSSPLVTHLY